MATPLNPGYKNNINTIQVRVNGAHSHRYTDRALENENYDARDLISEVTETDGGVSTDLGIGEFTKGVN